MKKYLVVVVVLVFVLLTGCSCKHKWADADCYTAKKCELCGLTEGDPLQHSWTDADCYKAKTCELCGLTEGDPRQHVWINADCTTAKTCRRCGLTQGEPLGHIMQAATCDKASTCKRCKETQGKALGHTWEEATYQTPKTCTRCGTTVGEPKNIFEENSISPSGESTYQRGFFVDYYTPEEYVNLYKMAEGLSATPKVAISESLFIAHQYFATYNTTEDKYVIMNAQGDIVRDYGDNSWPADRTRFEKMGSYAFVPILGNPATFEIIDEDGNLISMFSPGKDNYSIEYVCELGENYHIFAIYLNGNYVLRLLSPAGEIYGIKWPTRGLSYSMYDFQKELANGTIVIGSISEDLFYALYKNSRNKTYAFYFNIFGERVIDLSSDQTNYHIYQMGDFEKGYAKIYFRGADSKNYSAVIDKSGQFIGEPVKEG